ncbi:glycoside hydrolase family 13 protein [Companilactobacillus alimentarius]|uniref:Alpha-glycosidase n=1 Tax=Companilactobacillus alimentarius DSM 20249 TaxID=1423720 RepID=A0A2K9HFJ4_9LACO|nr:glycoside hydrolase family 13 protein [Companilactobacillus alimentarius]AUI71331.1 alpha-glycosidase [Companilactobacillus alimentarius DSM 20249]KRK74774.1 glycosyl hydrolase, family 13 [Companilactobacillus alimentarius DSM 20249]GEO44311.1 alpha-glycosidase [Companilactobacillus alimentarius]
MNTPAIYHRPDSEFAYLYKDNLMHIRLRTARGDVKRVDLIHGDPYTLDTQHWQEKTSSMERYLTTDLYDFWTIELTEPFKRISYAFKITGNDGITIFYGDHGIFSFEKNVLDSADNYFRMPYFHEIDRFKAPEWVKKTVWYQIFPERFANGDKTNDPENTLNWGSKDPSQTDFFGGDLQGVIDHLDYLTDLGINEIYFCPIFKAKSNHKYDTIDYMEIDPAFGDKETFKKLINECHKRGIRVMLDAVFNHMGDNSPQWQDVLENGRDSKYADWFHINKFPITYQDTGFDQAENITYDTFGFTPHMPKLNTANPEVKKYLLGIAKYWIKEFDIDAWRLDVANEIDHEFWRDFKKTCDSVKKDFYILGEVWHSSQGWLQGDQFSAVMNYAYTDSISKYLIKQEIPIDKMVSDINNQLMLYRDQTDQIQFNVLDSHDTARLLTETNDDKDLMKQVLAFTYLQPGVPCVYYGDEIGMDGGNDPGCRKCMVWDKSKQDLQLYDFFKQLIRFRRNNQEVLSEGKMVWERVQDDGLLILSRKDDKKIVKIILNSGIKDQNVKINQSVILSNLTITNNHELTISPKGFALVKD